METPILFLIFSRPDTTQSVFDAIRAAQPKRLYVAADGPRAARGEEEVALCKETRELVVNNIDWECEVHTLFRDDNLGCGVAVSQALKWFFDNEPEGIILEDDVLPHPDFFTYCEELLDRYRDSDEVYFISGNNYDFYEKDSSDSYYFSAYSHVWGWAGWRKTMSVYNFTLDGMNLRRYYKSMSQLGLTLRERLFWSQIFMKMKMKQIDSWAYPMSISLKYNKKLSIIPNTALIKNIGFDERATHTTGSDAEVQNRDYAPIMPLTHPTEILRNAEYDTKFASERCRQRKSLKRLFKTWRKYIVEI